MIWIISSVVLLGLLAMQWSDYKTQQKLKAWRKLLAIDQRKRVFNTLFSKVNGFMLSHESRQIHHNEMAFVYGEIEFEPFIALLSMCQINQYSVFYDLGCGTGKAVIACEIVYNVRKSCGIELLPLLYEAATQLQQTLLDIPEYYSQARRIHFRLGNICDADILDATHVFINSTGFFGDLWKTISRQVETVKKGTIIVTTSKKLASPCFEIQKITPIEMSWGVVDAYIQRRI